MDPQQKAETKYKTKALMGMINDKMEVGMAKIRGEDSAALEVAFIKATLQDEVVPKEKHVRTLKIACSGSSPRQTVNYVIHGLTKRLEENPKAWLVTLKTLIVFHRLMRETDPSFQEEMLRYSERTSHHRLLRLESFADHTTKETWDYSAWIRVYSLYLDERLSCFRTMRFDPQHDQGLENRESKLKSCPTPELLEHLPAVQKLLGRLISCVPEGSAQRNEIALLACSLVLQEVRSVYKVVCEGILNLVDRFFEMDRGDALKGIELVKENLVLNERLNAFVATISGIPQLRSSVQFPSMQPLPADFLSTLEDYIKDAPKSANPAKAGVTGGPVVQPAVTRSASAINRGGAPSTSPAPGGTRLIIGGPITSGPSSPDQASPPPAPAPAPVIDLLGGFESLTVSPPAPAAAPAAPAVISPGGAPAAPAAPAPPPASFDPFASFGGAPVPPAPAQAAAPMPAATPVPAASAAGPQQPYPYTGASSFANPAVAAAAAGMPFSFPPAPANPPQPPAPAPQPPPVNVFGQSAFGAPGAFGAPSPSAYPPQQAQAAAAAPAPFNPFSNTSTQSAVAPHMPPAPLASPAYSPAPGQGPPISPGGAPPPPVYANPFGGSPAGAAPAQPANPFGSPAGGMGVASPVPGAAPAAANPFGGAPAAAAPAAAAANNPFAAPAGAWGAAPAPPLVVMQQVAGYSLKKQADPLMDLSLDLFGKPQAPPTHQPMRPQAGGANGSPGGLL